jgi:alpha-tubulin suppressor-like RCC1 family protein
VPVQIHGLANISQVAAGQSHCLALDASGRVFAWGGNFSGQTGLGADLAYETPTQINSLSNIARIAAGKDFSLFCNAAGVLWGCGSSTN